MKYLLITAIIISAVVLCSFGIGVSDPQSNPVKIYNDSLENDRMKWMNEVMASIKGREKLPADSVFKNLKVIKGKNSVSAEHLLWMMNWGWSTELGVSCSHCHVKGKWESDSLETKDIARGMWTMRVTINSEILPSITRKNYDKDPAVSCITCHRGKPVPDAK
jgi:photosynthetic reaction center cytochrome c subunit